MAPVMTPKKKTDQGEGKEKADDPHAGGGKEESKNHQDHTEPEEDGLAVERSKPMAPTFEADSLANFAKKKEAHAQRNDHEEVAGKGIPIDESPRDRGHPPRPFQIKDMAVAAEKFNHPIEGFDDAHQHDDDNEVFRGPLPVGQKFPLQEKKE